MRGLHRHNRLNPHTRPGFSLAELMVAIGIFGIGMLMVAATFPVGLDQARIVSEESIAPIVANEAYATLRLLLDDPTPRVTLSGSNPGPFPFRDTLTQTSLQINLTNPASGGIRDINHWLGSGTANATLGEPTDSLGAAVRFYPSTPTSVLQPPYTWTTAYRSMDNNSDGILDNVQFFVFVERRSTATPSFAFADIPPSSRPPPDPNPLPQLQIPLPLVNPLLKLEWYSESFAEGQILIRDDGTMTEIKNIDPTRQLLTVDTNVNPSDVIVPRGFAFIPVDPATGRSPVIATYSRTFPLN